MNIFTLWFSLHFQLFILVIQLRIFLFLISFAFLITVFEAALFYWNSKIEIWIGITMECGYVHYLNILDIRKQLGNFNSFRLSKKGESIFSFQRRIQCCDAAFFFSLGSGTCFNWTIVYWNLKTSYYIMNCLPWTFRIKSDWQIMIDIYLN